MKPKPMKPEPPRSRPPWSEPAGRRPRRSRGLLVLALVAAISLVALPACGRPGAIGESGAAAPPPWLHVEGNRIVDEQGQPVLLRGVAIEDPRSGSHRIREKDIAELVGNWGVNVIRVPVHPNLWEHKPKFYEKALDDLVALGRKYGIYILIGWHAHGNALTGEVEQVDWAWESPYRGNPYNPSLDLAVRFWEATAKRYKDCSWVIFSVFNEPGFITWDQWRPVAEKLVDVIRAHAPRALVLVPGVEWSYDLRGVGANPVRRENIVYEAHVYPGATKWHGSWDRYFGYLAADHAVFVGEWGFEPGSQDENLNATAEDYGRPLLAYLDKKGISWTAWVWSPVWTPPLLESWNYEPTEFGELVKEATGKR
jgi:aryl-phospho-beta-D-glucosidase BglC (GH1 family)